MINNIRREQNKYIKYLSVVVERFRILKQLFIFQNVLEVFQEKRTNSTHNSLHKSKRHLQHGKRKKKHILKQFLAQYSCLEHFHTVGFSGIIFL